MKRHSQGTTLIEVMISLSLMSVIMLGIASMINISNRAAMSTKSVSEFNSLINTIQGILNNSDSCIKILTSHVINPSAPFPQTSTALKTNGATGVVIAQVGPYGSSLEIKKIEFTSAILVNLPNYLVTLRIEAEKKVGGGVIGYNITSHDFKVQVSLDATNHVLACSGMSDVIWQRAANNVDIYYNGGRVGIGTATPNQALTVVGNVAAGAGIVGSPAYMFNPTTFYGATGMYAPAANNVAFVTGGAERVRIEPSGNVAIGTTTSSTKLTVAGEIKIGNTGIACPGNAGAIRYTGVEVQFCNGATWASIGGSVYLNVFCQGSGVSGHCTPSCPPGFSLISDVPISSYLYWTHVGLCKK